VKKIALLIFILLRTLYAEATIDTKDISNKHDNFEIYYYEDFNDDLKYDEIKDTIFKNSIQNRFSLGYIHHPVWFKINIYNSSKKDQNYILALHEVFYDEVFLFYEYGGFLIQKKSGVQVDLSEREINNPNAHFKITLPAERTTTFYIKARPFFGTFGQFFIYDYSFYNNHIQKEDFFYTFYLGSILAISFYNLFLFFYLRNRAYLYYFGYSLCFGLWTGGFFGGIAFYFIPIGYNYNLHMVTPIALLFLMLFSNEVLEVKKNHPSLYRLMQIHQILLVIASIMILFYNKLDFLFKLGFEFTNIVAVYIFFFYIYFAIKQISTNNKIAKIYLTAIGAFFISITILSMMAMGVLPNNFYTRYSFLGGSFLELILLSLLLAYRIDALQKNYQQTLEREIQRQTDSLNHKNKELARIVGEKDELLKEMFHRVKNNFQILISMLYLEISEENSKRLTSKIENVIKKLQSMSIVHSLLYGKDDRKKLETTAFFKKLTTHLDADFDLYVESFYLKNSLIKNLGLIVNELFTNAFKYSNNKVGLKIRINLTIENDVVCFEQNG